MKIGILGAGQLAQMLMLAGIPLGLRFAVYAPEATKTTWHLGQLEIGEYDDRDQLEKFCQQVDVITYEHENLPIACLQALAEINTPVSPSIQAVRTAQDRYLEKQLATRLGIPTNPFICVDTIADLEQAAQILGFPFLVKARRNGYDGKHQVRIADRKALETFAKQLPVDCLAEAWVPFDREISQIAVRNAEGEIRFYDVCENVHRSGILRKTQNKKNDPLMNEARHYLGLLLEYFNYVGVLTAEFFDVKGKLLLNELAPRVHNSGHWTIEGAVTSQFENHIRSICGLPLGECKSVSTCQMYNVISSWPVDKKTLLAIRYLALHDYLKEAREGRKLGHLTLQGQPEETSELNTQLTNWFCP